MLNLWLVVPHFSDWRTLQVQKETASDKLEKFQKEISQEGKYKSDIAKLESEGMEVPQEDQAIHFSSTIQSEANRAGVQINQTGRIVTRTNDPFFVELTQTLGVQSKEQNLVDFLFSLGSGNSLVRAKDLSLGPDPPRQQLSAKVTLVASYQRKPSARPAAAQPTPTRAATPASKPPKAEPKPAAPPAKPSTPGAKPETPKTKKL